jgi:hypothetical protein
MNLPANAYPANNGTTIDQYNFMKGLEAVKFLNLSALAG